MDKKAAQRAIEDAALAIGRDGGKDFVLAVSAIVENDQMGVVLTGETGQIIKGLIHAMEGDRDLRHILIGAVNGYALNKLFNRDCNCPACQARRKKAQQN